MHRRRNNFTTGTESWSHPDIPQAVTDKTKRKNIRHFSGTMQHIYHFC